MPAKDKVVIITGASSGIGWSTAEELAEHGAKLMLCARREGRLKELAEKLRARGTKVEFRKVDVTKRAEVDAMVEDTVKVFGRVDVLFNNAGLMPLSLFEKRHYDEWERMVDVNIKGLLYSAAAVVPHMKKANSGHIINVSSVAGHVVFTGGSVYCGTKFFVKAFSEGLRQELGTIRVTNISPGAIKTELPDTITDEDVKAGMKPVLDIAIAPESIARAVRFAVEQPDDTDVNEIIIRPVTQAL